MYLVPRSGWRSAQPRFRSSKPGLFLLEGAVTIVREMRPDGQVFLAHFWQMRWEPLMFPIPHHDAEHQRTSGGFARNA